MDNKLITCDNCGKFFERELKQQKYNSSRYLKKFCSQKCKHSSQVKPELVANCSWCGIEFSRKQGTRNKMKFCSKSCAARSAAQTKKDSSKKTKTKMCSCERRRIRVQSIQCRLCAIEEFNALTIREAKDRWGKNFHSSLRGRARYHYSRNLSCYVCDYSLHVDIAHIKAIVDFPPEATLAEVNAPTNLVALCPNHHWELDHGSLVINLEESSILSVPTTGRLTER